LHGRGMVRNLVKRQISFITNNASRWTGLKIRLKLSKMRIYNVKSWKIFIRQHVNGISRSEMNGQKTNQKGKEINQDVQIIMSMSGKVLVSNGEYKLVIMTLLPDENQYLYAVISTYKGRPYVDGIGMTPKQAVYNAVMRCDDFDDEAKIKALLKAYRQKYGDE